MTGYLRQCVVPAAYALLPPAMASDAATALLLAIGYQESRFTARRQVGGPARGFFMFELAGISGVLAHSQTAGPVRTAMRALSYPHIPTPIGCQLATEHNDVLALVFARLLLWTLPDPLPARTQPETGYRQYLDAWRPGKAKPDTWPDAWTFGWAA